MILTKRRLEHDAHSLFTRCKFTLGILVNVLQRFFGVWVSVSMKRKGEDIGNGSIMTAVGRGHTWVIRVGDLSGDGCVAGETNGMRTCRCFKFARSVAIAFGMGNNSLGRTLTSATLGASKAIASTSQMGSLPR